MLGEDVSSSGSIILIYTSYLEKESALQVGFYSSTLVLEKDLVLQVIFYSSTPHARIRSWYFIGRLLLICVSLFLSRIK